MKQKRLVDAGEHLAAALKDLNQHKLVESITTDAQEAVKPAEKLKQAAKKLAALLTTLQICALTALQTNGTPLSIDFLYMLADAVGLRSGK
jgi:hypothetical protein